MKNETKTERDRWKKNFLKKKEKQEGNKETEKELWNRLSELNKEFKDIREHKKKKLKKCQKQSLIYDRL